MQPKCYLFFCAMLLAVFAQGQQVSDADKKAFDSYFKSNEKNFTLIKTIDSLREKMVHLKNENDKNQAILSQVEYSNKVNLKNFDLYRLLARTEKDSLKNLASDSSKLLKVSDTGIVLQLNDEVNFQALSALTKENLEMQFPVFFSAVQSGKIRIEQLHYVMNACCGAGMVLPTWPSSSIAATNQNDLINLYRQQSGYFDVLFSVNACARRFRQLFNQKIATFTFPQQVESMVKCQITFKTFLQSATGCNL
ncbi:hypothetical protein [Sediminibacterium ginsengisoli]|uniref:DUF3347 domain-containing protein n=1 Tax=Sediminibacterium ginsengisoli TaxID=413434 RepID=A0A1T4KUA1_9BACT|nr:hypothetical protein [Sediminibacterium ginsengisoli]SJZ46025.1 hypothetical protein SAMN04488132_102121 [Sediminibacterium ginsengisoli]